MGGPDDYDDMSGRRIIGCIFKANAGVSPELSVDVDHHQSGGNGGFCASGDEAKAKLAETWRAWPALIKFQP